VRSRRRADLQVGTTWRLRFCDPEAATVNSSLELTVGLSSKEKPTVTFPGARATADRAKCGYGNVPFLRRLSYDLSFLHLLMMEPSSVGVPIVQ